VGFTVARDKGHPTAKFEFRVEGECPFLSLFLGSGFFENSFPYLHAAHTVVLNAVLNVFVLSFAVECTFVLFNVLFLKNTLSSLFAPDRRSAKYL
jgi:hypothetical protein